MLEHLAAGRARPPAPGSSCGVPVAPEPLTPVGALVEPPPRSSGGRPLVVSSPRRPGGGPRSAHVLIAAAIGIAAAGPVRAQLLAPGDQFRLTYAPWTYHFNPSDEHVDFNHLVGGELVTRRWTFWGADRAMAGFAAFDNSFGQFSQYAWFGLEWDWARFAGGRVFVNATAGLLHGYKDEYQDKIPFNKFGIAPVIIPSLGIRWGRFSVQANLLGGNGLLFGASWVFDLVPGETMAVPIGAAASAR